MSTTFKSVFLSLSFVMVSAFSFAGNEVLSLDAPATVIVMDDACTLSGTFTTGDISVEVSVTASDCAGAAAGLAAVAKAIDEM